MDKSLIWLALGLGSLALAAIMYFVIQNLYLRLKNFAQKWMYDHPNAVTEIRIKLDDLSCAIQNGVEQFKLNLAGKTQAGGAVVIVTDETLGRREMEALYKRETEKERIVLATAC